MAVVVGVVLVSPPPPRARATPVTAAAPAAAAAPIFVAGSVVAIAVPRVLHPHEGRRCRDVGRRTGEADLQRLQGTKKANLLPHPPDHVLRHLRRGEGDVGPAAPPGEPGVLVVEHRRHGTVLGALHPDRGLRHAPGDVADVDLQVGGGRRLLRELGGRRLLALGALERASQRDLPLSGPAKREHEITIGGQRSFGIILLLALLLLERAAHDRRSGIPGHRGCLRDRPRHVVPLLGGLLLRELREHVQARERARSRLCVHGLGKRRRSRHRIARVHHAG
mmetsp:Transcript_20161/g.56667  ORF Transcript_20161/g.56667 Transcript_20161/m.56667 type:complete len:279 (+) Transcript_20161:591-1427(+)